MTQTTVAGSICVESALAKIVCEPFDSAVQHCKQTVDKAVETFDGYVICGLPVYTVELPVRLHLCLATASALMTYQPLTGVMSCQAD